MPDDIWLVLADYLKSEGYPVTDALRKKIEALEITNFPGGVFIAIGPRFDLFVKPEKRGKWNIRGIFGGYVNGLIKRYGKAEAAINENNAASLRLAKGFGFIETGRCNGKVQMERTWAI